MGHMAALPPTKNFKNKKPDAFVFLLISPFNIFQQNPWDRARTFNDTSTRRLTH